MLKQPITPILYRSIVADLDIYLITISTNIPTRFQ